MQKPPRQLGAATTDEATRGNTRRKGTAIPTQGAPTAGGRPRLTGRGEWGRAAFLRAAARAPARRAQARPSWRVRPTSTTGCVAVAAPWRRCSAYTPGGTLVGHRGCHAVPGGVATVPPATERPSASANCQATESASAKRRLTSGRLSTTSHGGAQWPFRGSGNSWSQGGLRLSARVSSRRELGAGAAVQPCWAAGSRRPGLCSERQPGQFGVGRLAAAPHHGHRRGHPARAVHPDVVDGQRIAGHPRPVQHGQVCDEVHAASPPAPGGFRAGWAPRP